VKTIASLGVASTDLFERYLLDQEDRFSREERLAIEQELAQLPILQ
jgi:hypothetical protein